MARFSQCRELTLTGVCRDCVCHCADRLPNLTPAAECTEPLTIGSNILAHPGVETQLTVVGGGPNGDEIPTFHTSIYKTVWTDGSDAPTDKTWVAQVISPSQDVEWMVSTVSPRTGTYHLRNAAKDGSPTDWTSYWLWWIEKLPRCDSPNAYYSARLGPGDFVRWGAYAKNNKATGNPYIRLEIEFYAQDDSYLGAVSSEDFGSATGELEITTSYAWYEVTAVAPATTYYINVLLYFSVGSDPLGRIYDLDDAVLEVS